jgi:branched-chain amino acid transport system substrate-binding protein
VPYRYTKTEHGGFDGVEMGQVRNGKIVLFGGPLTTQPTAGSAITPYTGTPPAPPASGIPSN